MMFLAFCFDWSDMMKLIISCGIIVLVAIILLLLSFIGDDPSKNIPKKKSENIGNGTTCDHYPGNNHLRFLRKNSLQAMEDNKILYEGEPLFEIDTNRLKIGDGIHRYNDLPYIGEGLPKRKRKKRGE